MKKSRFTDSQIIDALKRAEAGLTVPELCRELGISSATFAEPSHVGEMASPLFCESLGDDLRLELLLDVHLAQAPVLLFQLLHASHE